jgi:RNA polymerase sigma-70 factor (ECF subfamily)
MFSPPTMLDRELLLAFAPEQSAARASTVEDEVLSLFDQLQPRLLRYALSFGLPREDGEDVIQETFMALFSHLQKDRSRENLPGWLFRVTHNLALKQRKKSRREIPVIDSSLELDVEFSDSALSQEQQMLHGERHLRLLSGVRALPEKDQRCLRLRAEGLRYRQIATVLGISLGSVSLSITRSLARLERLDQATNSMERRR